ncbi:hypothetical protein PUN28_013399 [Cardiocondyla obscurior]|uniref:Uncharacterized protein n=1 Tax=Cardiocondyla obscurior TaxID=286306 RepID=A0AAW2F9F6_9HYME
MGLIGTDRQNGCELPRQDQEDQHSEEWFPPVAKDGGLQRLRRLHHRYQEPSRNEGREVEEEEAASTAKSFAEVGKRRWGKFSFAGCL